MGATAPEATELVASAEWITAVHAAAAEGDWAAASASLFATLPPQAQAAASELDAEVYPPASHEPGAVDALPVVRPAFLPPAAAPHASALTAAAAGRVVRAGVAAALLRGAAQAPRCDPSTGRADRDGVSAEPLAAAVAAAEALLGAVATGSGTDAVALADSSGGLSRLLAAARHVIALRRALLHHAPAPLQETAAAGGPSSLSEPQSREPQSRALLSALVAAWKGGLLRLPAGLVQIAACAGGALAAAAAEDRGAPPPLLPGETDRSLADADGTFSATAQALLLLPSSGARSGGAVLASVAGEVAAALSEAAGAAAADTTLRALCSSAVSGAPGAVVTPATAATESLEAGLRLATACCSRAGRSVAFAAAARFLQVCGWVGGGLASALRVKRSEAQFAC